VLDSEQRKHFAKDMLKLNHALLRLVNGVESSADAIRGMARQGKVTDARLNVLVNVVERFISGRRS
jgi:hypothetical protein